MREDYSNYLLGLVLIICLLLLGVYGTRDHKPKTITKTEYIINSIKDTIEVSKTKVRTITNLKTDTLTTTDTLYTQIAVRDTLILLQDSLITIQDTVILNQQDAIDSLIATHKKTLRQAKIKSFAKGTSVGVLIGAGVTVGILVF